ncbi:MAG: sialidase family protein [Anaerolineae bacterium]
MFTEMDLFISGLDSTNIYRIPSIILAPSGTILAFVEAREGDDGDPTDLNLKRSLYPGTKDSSRLLNGYPRGFGYGTRWEPMRTVLPGEGEAIMNPCPVVDESSGRIWLPCYQVFGGLIDHLTDSLKGNFLLTWSDDEGLTWAPPRNLNHSVPRFIPGPGISIQMRNGRLVIPGYWSPKADVPTRSCVVYSDDHGCTWYQGAQVLANTDESQAVELSDGTLLLNCRSNAGKACRLLAFSRDGGETWFEEHHEPALTDPVCQASLVRLAHPGDDGSTPWLLFFNCNATDRTNLAVKVSTDDGRTWPIARTIHSAHAAYSCGVVLRDGTIGVLYETGKEHPYEKVTFARFDTEWMMGK